MSEEIPSIDEVIESHNEYITGFVKNLKLWRRVCQKELEKQRAQIEQTHENLKQQKVEYDKISREYIEQSNAWESGLAENLGLNPAEVNFNTFEHLKRRLYIRIYL